ncbi:hypothetical protein Tco_1418694 [Tanacetum coccineum]
MGERGEKVRKSLQSYSLWAFVTGKWINIDNLKTSSANLDHDKYIQASGDVNIFGRRLSLGQYKKLRQYALSPLQKSEYVASCKVVYNESTFHVRRAGREGGGEFPLRRRRSIIHYSEQNTGTFEIVMSKGSLGKVLQQFGLPHLSDDQDVPHIRRRGKLAKRCLILRNHSKLTYLFDDAHGVECFPKQVIWDELKILGYEGIPPLTPHMLEVVTALAAEEAHSTSPYSRDARDAQGTPDQSAAQASVSQRTAEVQGRILKKQTLSQVQINSQAEGQTQEPVKGGSSSGETSRFLGRKSAPCEAKETKKEAKEENDLHILVAIQSQPQPSKPSQATDPKDKGQVAKKGLGGGGGGQAEWDAEEERKRLEELKKAKPKTTSLAQERNQMMNFLKGQGYKNLQKLKYPQMKELYDKVQESIKDSFKDFIPMAQRKKWGGGRCLKERENKKTFMKRKATISEEQPSKKLKLRTETVDEIRNYLRVHTLELEDGTMIHMLAERRYPLSRELMIRMLDHGMEVEDESEIAITLIHLFILWTTEDGIENRLESRLVEKKRKIYGNVFHHSLDLDKDYLKIQRLRGKDRMSDDVIFRRNYFEWRCFFGHCPMENGDVSSGGSRNSRGKRLAIYMVVEAWLSKKEEVQQATGGPTYLGVASEEGASPQLSSVVSASLSKPIYSASTILHSEFASRHDASADSTVEKEIKLGDLSKLVPNLDVDFMDLDSPENEHPIIVEDKEEEEVHAEKDDTERSQNSKLKKEKIKAKAEVAFLSAQPTYPDVEQLTELLVKSLSPELSELLSSHDFSSSLQTKLKELPSKFNDLTREIKELKKHVHELKIELPGDLKEIPTKLEQFSSIISSLTTQVTKLNTFQWELPATFIHVPGQVSNVQAKIKTLDVLPSLINKGKKAMSFKDAEDKGIESEYDDDANLTSLMGESSKKKKMKKFDFVTEGGDHIYLTEE